MSQNIERLFALEGGDKRRGAKKGSKKASKGKKAMRGGAPPAGCSAAMNTVASKYPKKVSSEDFEFNKKHQGVETYFNSPIKACTTESGINNPMCKSEIEAVWRKAQGECAKDTACNAKITAANATIYSNPVEGLKQLLAAKKDCGMAGGAKRKSKKGSKKAQKGGKRGSKKASKKASKGKKASRKH